MIKGQIQQIRQKLYLRRDGASSASMREKGLEYKLNWGVPVYTLKEIAREYTPDPALADELWKQNTRELKLLATLLYPVEKFDKIEEWGSAITSIELAEQAVLNLFSKLPTASRYATRWIASDEEYLRLMGYLLFIRLFMRGYKMNPSEEQTYFASVFGVLGITDLGLNYKALNSLILLAKENDYYQEKVREQAQHSPDLTEELRTMVLEELEGE
ncbi:DNA alkylation repair protein [Bacteroidales bacterium OttesenSCG-928-J19]|nr:DNA alkylation repair protein [Bacteroidales bacterium OttesenSCG-928-J19]